MEIPKVMKEKDNNKKIGHRELRSIFYGATVGVIHNFLIIILLNLDKEFFANKIVLNFHILHIIFYYYYRRMHEDKRNTYHHLLVLFS